MNWDWGAIKEAGIAAVVVVFIYFGFQSLKLILAQWKNSNDSLNKNTAAFTKLSQVFEKQSAREEAFQREILHLVKESKETADETNKKVIEIHQKIL